MIMLKQNMNGSWMFWIWMHKKFCTFMQISFRVQKEHFAVLVSKQLTIYNNHILFLGWLDSVCLNIYASLKMQRLHPVQKAPLDLHGWKCLTYNNMHTAYISYKNEPPSGIYTAITWTMCLLALNININYASNFLIVIFWVGG